MASVLESVRRRLLDSLGSPRTHIVQPILMRAGLRLAVLLRARFRSIVVIGVTGSAGKSMTKDLVAGMLSLHLSGRKSSGTANELHDVARAIRSVRQRDRFLVVEVGAPHPGAIDPPLALLRPHVGVVTNIGTDHFRAYGSTDGIAAEKRKLIQALPDNGVAVLNADDPRVLAMADTFRGRVITYGLQGSAHLRAEQVTSAWPSRLSFTLVYEGRRVFVQTQLCGTHWISSVLAATGVAMAMGLSLDDAARALHSAEPFMGRMSPLQTPDGITFIRDDWKASVHTIPPALAFMEQAEARRKIAIIGTIADTSGDSGATYVATARRALQAVDFVCFVGPNAAIALRAKGDAAENRLHAFGTVRTASEFLGGFLRAGDLVLLKGSNTADHLYRIILARAQRVRCWQDRCKRNRFCDTCSLLDVESGGAPEPFPEALPNLDRTVEREPPAHVVVGLGNHGERYRNTPHNVGHTVLDRLATLLKVNWQETPDAYIAGGIWKGQTVSLVKPLSFVNETGRALVKVAHHLGIRADQYILIYDDHDLPMGTVRRRMRGSDGGHRGVRSVIEAFQTDQLRRIKVGVKRARPMPRLDEAVLTPFDLEEQSVVSGACDEAIRLLGELLIEQASTNPAAR